MKKLTSIILTLALLLSVIVVTVYADNDVQTVFGETTGMVNDSYGIKYIISTETGSNIEAYADDGVSLSLGICALFTIETRTNGEKYITNYENIPEYGYEIGYLAGVSKDSFLGDVYNIRLFTDKKEDMCISRRVRINGVRYSDDDIITALTPQVENFIAYKLDEEGDISDIVFVDIKTPQEKYKVNSDTKFFINTGTYYQISNLPDGYNYSYEVLSYDKNYNARAVKITELYKTDIAFYSHSFGIYYMVDADGEEKQTVSLVTADGEQKRLCLNENCIISDTVTAENFDGIIEYKINAEDEITEITALTGSDFSGYIVNDGKIGENVITDTAIFEVIDNNNIEHRHDWTYSKFNASDKLQYCGKIYTSSYGKRIIWITGSEPAVGNPIVGFWSTAYIDGSNSSFRVGVTYEKNGYTGSGTIYLAVYYKERLHAIYTYSLSDAESIYNEKYKELEDVIMENVPYDGTTNINDYTVKGFVWYDNLSPIYPAVPVDIR